MVFCDHVGVCFVHINSLAFGYKAACVVNGMERNFYSLVSLSQASRLGSVKRLCGSIGGLNVVGNETLGDLVFHRCRFRRLWLAGLLDVRAIGIGVGVDLVHGSTGYGAGLERGG
jgi:hypothetical protein